MLQAEDKQRLGWFQELPKNPYMYLPAEEVKWSWVLQAHGRGKSVSDLTPIVIKDERGCHVVPISALLGLETEIPLRDTFIWGKNGFEEVKWAMRHQVKELFRVQARAGSVDVTPDHSLFLNGEPVQVNELKKGQTLDTCKLPFLQGVIEVPEYFAWTLGFFLADGSMVKGYARLCNTNPDNFKNPKELCRAFGLSFSEMKDHRPGKKTCFYLEIHGLDVWKKCYYVAPHSNIRKSRLKIIPSFVFSWNRESQLAFLEGFLAGDGEHKAPSYFLDRFNFANSSQALSQGLLILTHGIFPDSDVNISLQGELFKVSFIDPTHNRTHPAGLIKSKEKALMNVSQRDKNNANYKHGNYVRHFRKTPFSYSFKRFVYDVETSSHSFMAGVGRILAHNSVHGDLRFQVTKDVLVGWTLNWIKAAPEAKNLSDAKKIINERLPKAFNLLLDPHLKTVTETKSPEPREWLDAEVWFPAGTVGATKFLPGYMIITDKGTVEFGSQKSTFHEYFLWGKHLTGRFVVRQLPNVWRRKSLETGEVEKTGRGYTVWMSFFTDPRPYAISPRALSKKWYPPEGKSCLPKYIRVQIPKDYRYWKLRGKEAHEVRDKLIEAIKSKETIIRYPIVKTTELEKFAKPGRPKLPPAEKKIPEPEKPVVSTPSTSVEVKMKTVLCYDPPKELKFIWVLERHGKGKEPPCGNCRWLAENSPFTLDTLPTYPHEGKTFCGAACTCGLDVIFPDGIRYEVIPVKNKAMYETEYMTDWISKEVGSDLDHPMDSLRTYCLKEFEKVKLQLVGLWVDYENMDQIDKAFMIFAAQPLVRDTIIAYSQATKEVYLTHGLDVKEEVCMIKGMWRHLKWDEEIERVTTRLLNEEQVKDVQEQLSFIESFMLEVITSVFLSPVTKQAFKLLRTAISKIKDFRDAPVIGETINKALMDAEEYRKVKLDERTLLEVEAAEDAIAELKLWTLEAGDELMRYVDKFVTFYKDCVLIFFPAVPIRNVADNTVKMLNEMLNSFLKGQFFWPWFGTKQVKLLDIPDAVKKSAWETAMDVKKTKALKTAEGFLGKANCYWQSLRTTLYDFLLGKPERWFREAVYAGKLSAYEKDLIALGKNADFIENLTFYEKKAIAEVNRIFFDYSKRMAVEIPLGRLAPFEFFNVRNFNYWLEDFMHYPWKLSVVRSIWDFFEEQRGPVDYRIEDKLPTLLIPGVYFNPFAYTSAWDFIKVFAMWKGKPDWFEARERHLAWQAETLNKMEPTQRDLILNLRKYRDVQDYLDRQKYTWLKYGIEFLDEYVHLHPLLKEALAEIHLVEKKGDIATFPQGPLVSALTSAAFNDFYGSIKPPSPKRAGEIYDYMEKVGLERDREQCEELHRAWEVQKIVVQYFTGMYLTLAWQEIEGMHRGVIDSCEKPGG